MCLVPHGLTVSWHRLLYERLFYSFTSFHFTASFHFEAASGPFCLLINSSQHFITKINLFQQQLDREEIYFGNECWKTIVYIPSFRHPLSSKNLFLKDGHCFISSEETFYWTDELKQLSSVPFSCDPTLAHQSRQLTESQLFVLNFILISALFC